MAKKTSSKETDQNYLFKIVLYFLLGLLWVRVEGRNVLPAGLVLGLLISKKEQLQIDRKIEYVVLLMGAVIGYIGYGLSLNLT